MTTPAVHINARQSLPGYQGAFDPKAGVWYEPPYPDGPWPYRVQTEDRPVSVNSPKSASGWRAPCDFWHYGSSWKLGLVTWMNAGDGYQYHSVYGENSGWNDSKFGIPNPPMFMENSAVSKALLKLKAQKVNLSVAFAERGETGELAIDAMNRVVGLLKTLGKRHGLSWYQLKSLTAGTLRSASKKRNAYLRNALNRRLGRERNPLNQRNTKKLLNDFLQVQYGVRPLMQDVFGASDALCNKERDGDAYRATVKATVKQDETSAWNESSFQSGGYLYYPATAHVVHVGYVRLDYVLDNPVLATLSSLGITNPAELFWERVPFSFVVDWFLPVGNYLSAFDAALGWSFLAGSYSAISRVTVKSDGAVPLKPTVILWERGSYFESNFSFVRKAYHSSPWVWIPVLKNPLSGQHVANAIALAAARLR